MTPPSPPESLSDAQRRFVPMVAKLIEWVYKQPGMSLTFGEAWRTPEQALWNQQHGLGIAKSLHCERLAIDLNLFIDGEYQTTGDPYTPLGVFWESIGGVWGGRFVHPRPDFDHFEIALNGVE